MNGKRAFAGADAVVIKDVKAHPIVVGKLVGQVGWFGPSGVRSEKVSKQIYKCPATSTEYELIDLELHEILHK